MATYIGAIVDFCTGKVFLNSSSPKKLLWIVVPTVASVFLLGIFSARKSKRVTAPAVQAVEVKVAKRERVTIDNFLSNDIVPQEIINKILSLMSSEDLAKFGQVSRKFSMLVNDGDLWLYLLQQRWPDEDYSIHPSNYLQSLYSKKAKLEKVRLGFTPGRVLLSVMRQCANFSGEEKDEDNNEMIEEGWWQKRFINELSAAECGVSVVEGKEEEIETEGEITIKGKGKEREEETQLFWFETADMQKLGWMRFLDVSDARKKFAGNKMLQEKTDSPFTGEIVGYINMDFIKTPENARTIRDFLQTLLYETRGIVGRVDNGYYTHSVLLKTFPLSELLSSEGMNEGDNLLDSDINSEYITTLMQSARILLNENNINNVTVKYLSTSTNPLRCSEITPKMHELSLPVWVFNIDMLSNKTMWNNIYY